MSNFNHRTFPPTTMATRFRITSGSRSNRVTGSTSECHSNIVAFSEGIAWLSLIVLFLVVAPRVQAAPVVSPQVATDIRSVAVQESQQSTSPLFSAGVSIPPQAYFVHRISGGLVEAVVLIDGGADPHNFAPAPATVRALSKTSLYFGIGLEVETHWKPKFVSGNTKIVWVDTSSEEVSHHAWLSVKHVRYTVEVMLAELSRLAPAYRTQFAKNAAQIVKELEELSRVIQELFEERSSAITRTFLSDHAAWENFSEELNLDMLVIKRDGKRPSVRHLAKLIQQARELGLNRIIVDKGHSEKEARIVADSLGAQLVELDPIAYDWFDNMRAAAIAIEDATR